MKFNDFKYVRPDYDDVKEKYLNLINAFKNSSTADDQYSFFKEINALSKQVETMAQLAHIRNSINTADEFYDREKDYMDMTTPKFNGLRVEFYKQLLNSKFKEELKEKIHPQLFTLAEMEIKTFSDEVVPLMQEENKLII